MTSLETLIHKFNTEFGFDNWPETYPVSMLTYYNVLKEVLIRKAVETPYRFINGGYERRTIELTVGINGGIVIKNVELILE